MEELAARCGTTIAGGDVVARAGARRDGHRDRLGRRARASWSAATAPAPGDLVGVTGELGGSEAGRALLEAGEREPAELVRRHLRPQPRPGRGPRAGRGGRERDDRPERRARHRRRATWPRPAASSCGSRSTRCRARRASSRSPRPRGGDDYELLFTIAPERREAAEAAAPVSWLGDVLAGARARPARRRRAAGRAACADTSTSETGRRAGASPRRPRACRPRTRPLDRPRERVLVRRAHHRKRTCSAHPSCGYRRARVTRRAQRHPAGLPAEREAGPSVDRAGRPSGGLAARSAGER